MSTVTTVKAFYQSVDYEPIRDRRIRRQKPGPDQKLSNRYPIVTNVMFEYYEETSAERVGILHGEHFLHPTGFLLINREGFITAINMSVEDFTVASWLHPSVKEIRYLEFINSVRDNWDFGIPADGCVVLSEPYERNYFHFTLEMVPRLRFFPMLHYRPLILHKTLLERVFQFDLLKRCIPENPLIIPERYIKVRNPLVSHDAMSEEGVFWLRETCPLRASAGSRRLYIRRSGQGTRTAGGGGIAETPEFLRFILDHGFEIIEFGNGDLTVAEQVSRLEGAGMILCAHGAALSNLVYLHGQVSVIEVLSQMVCRAMFMHLSTILNFRYYGIVSFDFDEKQDIILDLDELRDVIHSFL